MTDESLFYDDIVVGASPLMLMQALRLSSVGKKVLVIDRSVRIGGSWAVAEITTVTGLQSYKSISGSVTEVACHLIEVFPRVYKALEQISGVPFVPLDKQPIRLLRYGLRVRYFSRCLMLASGLRLMLGWIWARLRVIKGDMVGHEEYLNFDRKLASYFRYQLPTIFGDTRMYGPRDGYANFMISLEQRCREAGIKFIVGEVIGMRRELEGRWWLSLEGDLVGRKAHHVHLTTSTNLRLQDATCFTATPARFASRTAWIVAVPEAHILIRHTYISFWRDPDIARISRIDIPSDQVFDTCGCVHYLVENRHVPLDVALEELSSTTIRDHMERAGIIAPGGLMNVVGKVACKHVYNIDQLPAGHIAPGVWGYFSYGNLSAGIAAWLDQDTVPAKG